MGARKKVKKKKVFIDPYKDVVRPYMVKKKRERPKITIEEVVKSGRINRTTI